MRACDLGGRYSGMELLRTTTLLASVLHRLRAPGIFRLGRRSRIFLIDAGRRAELLGSLIRCGHWSSGFRRGRGRIGGRRCHWVGRRRRSHGIVRGRHRFHGRVLIGRGRCVLRHCSAAEQQCRANQDRFHYYLLMMRTGPPLGRLRQPFRSRSAVIKRGAAGFDP